MMIEVRKETREKMFMTGDHKTKLKHWQCILANHPEWIYESCKTKLNHLKFTYEELILSVIEIVADNNNLLEVKYYIELFLMKLIINKHSERIITPQILNVLSEKLLEMSSQVNKNVSFIVISGTTINYLFKTYKITKNHPLYESL